jgi:pyocin large subunit-like protein
LAGLTAALVIAAVTALFGVAEPDGGALAPPRPAPPPVERPAPSGFAADVGWTSPWSLASHFEKHGAAVGAADEAQYLARARGLRDARVGGDVLEIVRADGKRCRFDRATGAFLVFAPGGEIITFFAPDDGEAYFERQRER